MCLMSFNVFSMARPPRHPWHSNVEWKSHDHPRAFGEPYACVPFDNDRSRAATFHCSSNMEALPSMRSAVFLVESLGVSLPRALGALERLLPLRPSADLSSCNRDPCHDTQTQ